MCLFVVRDLLEATTGVWGQAGVRESLLVKLLQGTGVERVLQVLKRKSIVQDRSV